MGNSLTSNNTTTSNVIDDQIKEECVVIYSTTVCSFCTKAKALMDEMGLEYSTVEIDKIPPSEGGRISHDLRAKTRMMTVPQIFINGNFVGGYAELVALQRAGSLMSKVAECAFRCKKK